MRYASYFSFSFTTPFQVVLWEEVGDQKREGMGFFMKLQSSDSLLYLSKGEEENPAFQKIATHQLVCDAAFPLERVKSWRVEGKSWILRDYENIQGLYFLKLAPKGISLND